MQHSQGAGDLDHRQRELLSLGRDAHACVPLVEVLALDEVHRHPEAAVSLDRVPLENLGGQGTAGSHWRRSVFGNELMNGFAGSGLQPLSLLTVQAMADMGYVVNTSAAEPWGQFLTSSANRGTTSNTSPTIP